MPILYQPTTQLTHARTHARSLAHARAGPHRNHQRKQLGQVIGRGFSSFVQHAIHKPTGTPLALKVINAFEKVKRDQLVKEIKTLCVV